MASSSGSVPNTTKLTHKPLLDGLDEACFFAKKTSEDSLDDMRVQALAFAHLKNVELYFAHIVEVEKLGKTEKRYISRQRKIISIELELREAHLKHIGDSYPGFLEKTSLNPVASGERKIRSEVEYHDLINRLIIQVNRISTAIREQCVAIFAHSIKNFVKKSQKDLTLARIHSLRALHNCIQKIEWMLNETELTTDLNWRSFFLKSFNYSCHIPIERMDVSESFDFSSRLQSALSNDHKLKKAITKEERRMDYAVLKRQISQKMDDLIAVFNVAKRALQERIDQGVTTLDFNEKNLTAPIRI